MRITILNGPNLNMLGTREPEIYGSMTLEEIEELCHKTADDHELVVDFKQTNHEGELIEWIQEAGHTSGGLILNAGGFTHTSVAIHDALRSINIPIIEVHLSDPKKREPFRHFSYVELVAKQSICGLGAQGYVKAIEAFVKA